MKNIEFPLFKTKVEGVDKEFDLSDYNQRQEYFNLKAGNEIEKIRQYLEKGSFIGYLLGKKSAGKGTYSKIFREVIAPDKVEHFSVGDMVRDLDETMKDEKKKKQLISFLEENYRGFTPLEEVVKSLEERSTKTLLPTEFILALVKKKIAEKEKKTLFIDGFPRNMDQVSYSLFFRDLIGYRNNPDFFILIDVPEKVIDERTKYRRVCPKCGTSRNLKLLPTSDVRYDKENEEFYLYCDNPECEGAKMVRKEGDEEGIAPIRERLDTDERLIEKVFNLYGIPKILLRNSIPVEKAREYVDDYEITPEYHYFWNGEKVEIKEKPWKIEDDRGVPSYSLLAAPVVVSLIKQLAAKLE